MVLDPMDLEWGTATPELLNPDHGIALHVLNLSLESSENVRRAIRFALARVRYYEKQLPAGWRQAIRLDDRGQQIGESTREQIKRAFSADCVSFFTEPNPKWLTT
jgi:hypothetical protein